ncbi:fructokinase [Clostridium amylolyticum]|uniref:Fructokinase n=1 Tax=Clostridium amylolyticum TaxID=1121298 RepID=A0A1M6GJN3_9CLOT|nr:carbohydrate kinase [Clostridium amylolyticum]SHJ10163.1 fructokinase [Clostridium amylolyticum]
MDKVLCIGELLIDFICSDFDVDLRQGVNFIKKAGGAPANVAAAISKLGGEAQFAGKVGADVFGEFLKNTLEESGVDASMLILDPRYKTTLAFVSLQSNGERDFIFNRGADEEFSYEELNKEEMLNAKIIHFGSATALLGGTSKECYIKAMKSAKDNNIFISFDPNYRVDLWKGKEDDFREISKSCLGYSDFVKVSDEEIKLISEEEDLSKAIKIFHELGAKVVAVTLGKDGTLISNGNDIEKVPSIKVTSIDSTGAGDAFVGAVLYKLLSMDNPKNIIDNFEALKDIIAFANTVGAIVCTKLGAIAALPTLDEVINIGSDESSAS